MTSKAVLTSNSIDKSSHILSEIASLKVEMKLPSWFPVSISSIEEGGSKTIAKKLATDIDQFLDNVVGLERDYHQKNYREPEISSSPVSDIKRNVRHSMEMLHSRWNGFQKDSKITIQKLRTDVQKRLSSLRGAKY